MTIIYDKVSSLFQFKTFTRLELRAKLIEILEVSILSKNGEAGLEVGDIIFAAKGTLNMDVYEIVGFAPPTVWQKLNLNGSRVDFGSRYNDQNLSVIAKKLDGKGGISANYVCLPSQVFVDFKRLNSGFHKLK